MTVAVGKPAPHFEAEVYVRGGVEPLRVSLSDFRGRWLILFFYPRDFTFVCPTEIKAFAELQPAFEREGAAVVGASTDSFFCHKAWFESDARLADVSYAVIADTSHVVSDAFGILSEDGGALRASFIIDPEGVVQHVSISDVNVGRNVEETLRTLQALRTGMLCPAGWRPGQPTLDEPALAT